jgi:hypothetical protein
MVEEILDQWYGPNDIFFKVRADDGNLYILSTGTSNAGREWSLESFRELDPAAEADGVHARPQGAEHVQGTGS